MPDRYGILQHVSDENLTYRRILKWQYLIVFHIKEGEKEVIIVDVTHSKQDPQKLIARLT